MNLSKPVAEFSKIPGRLNVLVSAVLLLLMLGMIVLLSLLSAWWHVALLAVGYGLVMNGAYAMLHEAEHRILHSNVRVNDGVGVVLALFFPAPFHLIRQGHIGHHMRNRSDDEAFDFYFEGESRLWKHLQFIGILTGVFWVVVVLSNVIALCYPKALRAKWAEFDRPTQALLESLNPRYLGWIRIEAALAIGLHVSLAWGLSIPWYHYVTLLCGFGVLWSALQYVHHYGTERDVLKGAKNLRTWRWLDKLWLNHNWHRNHHAHPTVSWVYLPELDPDAVDEPRERLLPAYLKMWRGPEFTDERVENRYAGKIIR
ncbi:MAG: fatty acid desaturase family protein [Akkermansiaceae bacterium]